MNPVKILDNIFRDVRFAMRGLYRNKTFTVGAVLALTLGIGINISIFTLLYSLAFRPLPVAEPGNITKVYQKFGGAISREIHGSPFMFSYPEYLYYRDQNHSFSNLMAYAEASFQMGGPDAESFSGLLVSANYFPTIGGSMALGRSFNPEECQTPGTHPVAIISHSLWERRFDSGQDVIGKSLVLNGYPFTVVGVAAPNVFGTELTIPDVWVPLMMESQVLAKRNDIPKWDSGWLNLVGRLNPGTSREQAQTEMSVLSHRLDDNYPGRKTSIIVSPGTLFSSPEERQTGAIAAIAIMIAVGLVLLIACANVSNLLLSRANARRKEIGIRLSLGATRNRLIQQFLTESVLIGLGGGALGLLLTSWLLRALVATVPILPRTFNVSPDFSVYLYTMLIAVLSGIACGLTPALAATRVNVNSALKEEGTNLGNRVSRSKMQSILLVTQVAVCLILLVNMGLLVRGLQRTQSIDLGFQPKNLYIATMDLRQQGYDNVQASAFFNRLLERLENIPGGKSASLMAEPPLLATNQMPISIEGRESQPGHEPTVYFNTVSPNYFKTMGIQLLRGSNFTEQDVRSGALVAIISQNMALRFWHGEDAIGKYFKTPDGQIQVVGIAKDVRNVRLTEGALPFFYTPVRPDKQLGMKVLLRPEGKPDILLGALMSEVRSIDPNIKISTKSMEESLERVMQPLKLSSLFSSALGLLALTLAMTGVYGVTAYATTQRTREVGIRMALGAKRWDILFLFIRQVIWPVAIGIVLGIIGAALTSPLILHLMVGFGSFDVLVFASASIFLAVVALVAMYLPASRATRVDPMIALRCD